MKFLFNTTNTSTWKQKTIDTECFYSPFSFEKAFHFSTESCVFNVFLDSRLRMYCANNSQQHQAQKTSQKKRQRVEINVYCCCIPCFILKNVLFFSSAALGFYDFMLCIKSHENFFFWKWKLPEKNDALRNFPKLCLWLGNWKAIPPVMEWVLSETFPFHDKSSHDDAQNQHKFTIAAIFSV